MEVKQIYTLMNDVTQEILGKSDVVAEDLQNVVDVGTQIFGATSVDNYVKSLVNHIGKVNSPNYYWERINTASGSTVQAREKTFLNICGPDIKTT